MAVASILVVPLIVWVIRLEVTMAVQTNDIERLQADMALESKVTEQVHANTVALTALTEKTKAADDKLAIIVGYLREKKNP